MCIYGQIYSIETKALEDNLWACKEVLRLKLSRTVALRTVWNCFLWAVLASDKGG